MKKWLSRTLVIAAVTGISATAMAGDRSHVDGYYDFAEVLNARPVTDIVRVDNPREVCWTENVTYHQPKRRNSHTPEIVGGIIGGVVGNQFGSGRGKDLATVAGAVLGGSIAHDYERRNARGYGSYTEPVQRCEVRNDYYEEERLVGYDVKYRYNGKVYHTRMDRDPGHTLRVRVNVAVAE